MSIIDDYAELPEDPELAFVYLEKKERKELWELLDSSNGYSATDFKMCYVNRVMAYHEALNISALQRPKLYRGSQDFEIEFDQFLDEVQYVVTVAELSHARRLQEIRVVVSLTPDLRQEIQEYIGKIRELIRPLDLTDEKKETIMNKIDALSNEIERDRTKVEALTAVTLEIASTAGRAAKELKHVKDLLDTVQNLLGVAKNFSEKLKIGSDKPTKLLEGPDRFRRDGKKEDGSDDGQARFSPMDDDIPF